MLEGFVIKCKECGTEVTVEAFNDVSFKSDSPIRVFTPYIDCEDVRIQCKCDNIEDIKE